MIPFTDALSELRRKALLRGQPVTNQEKMGLQEGYFDAASALVPQTRAAKLAEDQLKENRRMTEMQISAADKARQNQLLSNVGGTTVSFLGSDYLKSKPGESMIAKGYNAFTDAMGGAVDKIAGNLGMVPDLTKGADFYNALNAASQPMNFAQAINAAPSAINTGVSSVQPVLQGGVNGVGTLVPAATGATSAAPAAAGAVSNVGSGVMTAAGNVIPIYGWAKTAAKLGGEALKSWGGQNPSNFVTQFGESLADKPLGVEKYWLDKAGAGGIGRGAAALMNPLGEAVDWLEGLFG